MQLNKNQIVEIHLKDLIFHILYRWRSILLAALIGAIVLCAYQCISIKIEHDKGKLTKEERQYQLNSQKYQDDLEKSQNIIRINTKMLKGQNTYQNESIYFQLDSQKVWTANKKYLIKPDQSVLDKLPQGSSIDPADSILSAYTAPLSEATEEELKESFGTDKPEYVSELINILIDIDSNTVTVSVKGSTKEAVLKGLELLNTKMETIASGKAQEIDKHDFLKVNESISQGPDEDLKTKQENVAETITNLQKSLQDARKSLDELEAEEPPKEPGLHLARMAVIGIILGVVVLVLLYAVLYVLNSKLHDSNDLSQRYHLPIIGEFTTSSRIHTNKGLDRLISKWELGGKTISNDKMYDNIAVLIAKKQEAKEILIVSTLSMEIVSSVQENLIKRLPDRTLNVQADINYNSKGITEASKADAVILAEAKGISNIKETDRMVETLIIAEANVIGAIVL